jgi:hypothetical protein
MADAQPCEVGATLVPLNIDTTMYVKRSSKNAQFVYSNYFHNAEQQHSGCMKQ